jgi:hypothetical protein
VVQQVQFPHLPDRGLGPSGVGVVGTFAVAVALMAAGELLDPLRDEVF